MNSFKIIIRQDELITNYIDKKYHIKKKNNTYYLNNGDSLKIGKSYCLIQTKKYLRQLMCLFYVYHKNIFVCNFEKGEYFWLQEKLSSQYKNC